MTEAPVAGPDVPDKPGMTRTDRRKARTRASLVRAAQQLIAEGRSSVPILEITQLADVGMGSFYNHFETKDDLFQAAVDDALERHGTLMDALTADLDDPAEAFAQSFRLTGRLHRVAPELSKVLLSYGPGMVTSGRGLAPRALRDIRLAVEAGRFTVADPEIGLTVAGGAALALGQLLHDRPERDDATTTDETTEAVLRMLGLPPEEAAELCRRPLPEVRVAADGSVA
ncbi:TetR/AcrR family transcriptional regulator [Nocardioides pelophilus]|uniref:TetR/AcrR family transcriptional regulator n=1 Tax=Nocardioides pelophilus TaxID=2172019 RepID=UPI001FE29488|nr:TetR/AcrR family transcriptional regulator [Nocardioides pelophilus]